MSSRSEHPDLTAQRELARVTELLVGVMRMIESPENVTWPDGLWNWYEDWKSANVEH
jgi:hypothetical protein